MPICRHWELASTAKCSTFLAIRQTAFTAHSTSTTFSTLSIAHRSTRIRVCYWETKVSRGRFLQTLCTRQKDAGRQRTNVGEIDSRWKKIKPMRTMFQLN